MNNTNVNEHFLIPDYVEKIENLISGMKYGTITIVVQDGHIVQLEKNEKIRIKAGS